MSLPTAGGEADDMHSSRHIQWAQALILIIVLTFPAAISLRLACVADPDVWWHLRTGEWILQHHAIPQADVPLFCSSGAGKSWASYSWLFETLIEKLFQWLGLTGIVAYTTIMALAITAAVHRLIRRLQADFTIAALLTFVASFSICRLYTPRPWLFTILFFALELDLLMQARRTGRIRGLLWLPVLFALWANLHIQFIDGLVVLVIPLVEALLAHWWSGFHTRIRIGWMCGISAASIFATLANPYGWKIFRFAYDLASQQGVLDNVAESQALSFRRIDDWCVLFLALTAAGVLAKLRSNVSFETVLLVFSVWVSFRSQRDVWLVVIAASAILAAGLKRDQANPNQIRISVTPFIGIGAVFAILLVARVFHVNNARLHSDLVENLPVRAVEAVKQNGWNGPIYNEFNWGGYLIWALRMPVAIDGRSALYGDARLDRFIATSNGQLGWDSDPELVKAGLVIEPVTAPLTQLLRRDPRFQIAYEDKLAAVFVATRSLSSQTTPDHAAAAHAQVR